MFGNTPVGIIVLDIILLMFGGILIPLLWVIFKSLRDIGDNSKKFNAQTSAIMEKLTSVSQQLTDSHLRDKDIMHELDILRRGK